MLKSRRSCQRANQKGKISIRLDYLCLSLKSNMKSRRSIVNKNSRLVTLFELTLVEAGELLPEWHAYSLHPQLLRALHSKNFLTPTPIQAASLPVAFADRDVVGVAQTVRMIYHLLCRQRSSFLFIGLW